MMHVHDRNAMPLTRRSLVAAAALCTTAPPLRAERIKGLAVQSVIELFTSQGCSSCPPADLLLHTLKAEPGVLALSLPVTIWDHLGWKDTLAQAAFSERQKIYAHLRGDRQVYTPQTVINGVEHCVGSDRAAIDGARRDTVSRANVLSIMPSLKRDGGPWMLSLPEAPSGHRAPVATAAGASGRQPQPAGTILLVMFQREGQVSIRRGENSGRIVRYGNVVRSIVPIGEYSGAALKMPVPAQAHSDGADGFAILVQAGGLTAPGAIIGAVESPRG